MKDQIVATSIGGFLVLQIVLEHIFYMGNLSQLRYTLITDVSKSLLLLIAIFSTVGLVADILVKRRFQALVVSIALLLFSFAATYSNFKNSVIANQNIALINAESTSKFQKDIKNIVQAIDDRSSENVIIQMDSILDYELAYAVIQYLQYGRE